MVKISRDLIQIVNIEPDDFNNGFIELLNQLTISSTDNIDKLAFTNQIKKVTHCGQKDIFVIHDPTTNKVIGTSSNLYDHKFSRNFGTVAHIEDVIVDENYRGNGLGKLLVEKCMEIAKKNNCYKIILNCKDTNCAFYEKCGFEKKETQMVHYYNMTS